jgi:glycosyltransferase involved in cell wall biosynthesis
VDDVKVVMIAPACDGEDVGESWNAHRWASTMAERVDLTVLTTYKRGHTPPSRQLPGVRVVEWSEPPGIGRFERFNSLLQPAYVPFHRRARRWLRDELAAGERIDVVHQVTPVAMRYPSPAVGLGVPLVIGPVGGSLVSPPAFVPEEGAAPWYQRLRALDAFRMRRDPLLRRTYRNADCVVGIGPYVADLLAPVGVRRFESMWEVAVDRVPAPVDRGGRTGPVRLLHVGRVVRTKGLRDTIRAVGQLGDLDVHLDVVGAGNDLDACRDLVRDLELEDRVTFHGRVPRADVEDFYARADVFVFPSYREPGGGVVLEAMSWGLPVIVCDRGGPGANVTDACAIRLPAASPSQLADDCAAATRSLVLDAALRVRMGDQARAHVLEAHRWSDRLDRMLGIYGQLTRPEIRSGSVADA